MRKRIKVWNALLASLGVAACLVSKAPAALAQCAMCKATVQASATTNAAAASDVFNLAVLVLLVPPVLLFCALFILLLRYRKSLNDGAVESLDNAQGL
jgi:F0F1-type ATP synthase membrane subunit c/vacuolar-type H+-ATPase subunit K